MTVPVLRRRALLSLSAAALAGLKGPARAAGEQLKILVGFPAGTGLDVLTRIVAERVRIESGRTIVVENLGGGGGRMAAEAMARAEPDADTVLAAPIVTTAFAPFVFKQLGYDPLKDLAPLTRLGNFKFALAVRGDLPVSSLRDFIDYVKARPGTVTYGSLSSGTPSHFLGAMFNRATGTDLLHVPYRGSGPSIVGLLGGQVQSVFNTTVALLPLYRDGQVKLLAVTGRDRSPDLPDVPTFREAQLRLGDIEEAEMWYGFFASGRAPAERVRLLQDLLARALRDPATAARLRANEIEVAVDTPESFGALVRADHERWGRVIRESNFTLSE